VIAELRRLHDDGITIRFSDLELAGYWTRERVIHQRARSRQPLTTTALGKSLVSALWRHFGGLDQAPAAAKVRR
jgi:hypothetical protein